MLDKINNEQPRPGDGESVAFKDVCEHIAEGEFDEADALLAQIEGPAFARHVVHGHPLATVPTTAYWREQFERSGLLGLVSTDAPLVAVWYGDRCANANGRRQRRP